MVSYKIIPVATDTLNELKLPTIGILTKLSAIFKNAGLTPVPSEPIIIAVGTVRSV